MLALLALVLALAAGCADRDSAVPLDTTLVFGRPGTSPGEFAYPRAITADGDAVIVVDKAARLQRFDADTGEPVAWFQMREFDLGKPTGLTIGAHPTRPGARALYIADTHYHRVVITELPTEPGVHPDEIARFGAYGTGPGQFVYVTDVAVATGPDALPQRLYVSEYGGNDRVSIFDVVRTGDNLAFEFVSKIGTFGDGPEQFNRPQSVAIDPVRNELVIADGCNHRLGRFTLEGERIAWIGAPEDGSGLMTDTDMGLTGSGNAETDGAHTVRFHYPYSVVPLESGDWLVCEFGGNRVRLLDPGARAGSRLKRTYGGAGREVGHLASPWALALGGDDGRTAFVLDSRNNRVQAFRAPAPAADPGQARLGRAP